MGSSATELDCLRRLAAGEDDWPAFYRVFGGFITSQLRGAYGVDNPQDREDLYQQIVVKLLRDDCYWIRNHLAHWGDHSFLPLLRTVIRSAVCDIRRRKSFKLWSGAATDDRALERLSNPSGGAERRLQCRHALDCVFDSLARGLGNPEAYSVMHLRYVEEKDVKEIAQQLGMTENALSQRLRYYHKLMAKRHHAELLDLLDLLNG